MLLVGITSYIFFLLLCDAGTMQETWSVPLYSAKAIICEPCMFSVMWLYNGEGIVAKRGKYLINECRLEVLDFRKADVGSYSCINEHNNTILALDFIASEPTPYHSNIRRNIVPDSDSAEVPNTVYWHWKMQRLSNWVEFKDDPVVIHTYFYTSRRNTFPECKCGEMELVNNNHTASKADVDELNCDSLEETQRKLNGTCYQSSFVITHIEESLLLTCQVKLITISQNGEHLFDTGVISIDIKVLQDITRTFKESDDMIHALNAPNSMEAAIDNLGIFLNPSNDAQLNILTPSTEKPLLQAADDTKVVANVSRFDDETDDNRSQFDIAATANTSGTVTHTDTQIEDHWQLTSSTPVSVQSVHDNGTLNLSSLHPIYPQYYRLFQFIPHGSVNACLDGEYTMVCRFAQLTDVLELWFLGPVDTHSGVKAQSCLPTGECFRESSYLKASERFSLKMANLGVRSVFDPQVLLTLSNLTLRHSGVYLCKYRQFYRKLSVDVRLCGQRPEPSVLRNWPLAVLLGALLSILCLLLLPLVVCIRVRRTKRVLTVVSKVCPEDQARLSSRRIQIVGRSNLLYPDGKDLTFLSRTPSSRPRRLQVFRRPRPPIVAETAPLYYNSRDDHLWEVPSCRIHRQELIGQGGFSDVYRGTVLKPLPGDQPKPLGGSLVWTTVAIKQLKGFLESTRVSNLVHELEIMKRLESHANIVRLLGCCSRTGNGECHPTLLLEYAQHGNLRDYLRANRAKFKASVCELAGDAVVPSASLWPWEEPILLDGDGELSSNACLLLRFACQAANALNYLHSVKIIHRDVAARNVLLTREYVAKLSDFGLSRMLGDEEVDCTAAIGENLPLYWMSPESLRSSRFSLPSDIWSFGILLWELFSLGSSPYPGVSPSALTDWLESGHRNSRPLLTPDPVATVMHKCWQYSPADRTTAGKALWALTAAATPRPEGAAADRPASASQSGAMPYPPDWAMPSPTDSGIASIHHSGCSMEATAQQQSSSPSPLEQELEFDLTILRATADSDLDDSLGVEADAGAGGGRPVPGLKSPPRPPARTSSLVVGVDQVNAKVMVRKNRPPDLLDLPVQNYLDMRSASLDNYLEPRERLLMEVES